MTESAYTFDMPIRRPLTPRQHVILRGVARGKTNKEIAADLGISEQGVKVHISRLLERYGAENRVELVNLTGAWPASGGEYAAAAAEIAGIRAGLNKTYRDATSFAESRGGNGHALPLTPTGMAGHAAAPSGDLVNEVRLLREVLAEINVALKLARQLPRDADVGPLVDTILARVNAALEESVRLEAMASERTLSTPAAI